jgi:hypothetical protein
MSKQIFEEAFQRHPRPQLPTKAALLERSRKPGEDRPHANPTTKTRDNEKSTSAVIHEDPWNAMTRLGELIQGEQTWSVGVRLGRLVMVKKVDAETGRKALEKAQLLGQSNLASIAEVFHHESVYYLGFDYLRITLEEVLNVHARLDESQIRVIATSVWKPQTLAETYIQN